MIVAADLVGVALTVPLSPPPRPPPVSSLSGVGGVTVFDTDVADAAFTTLPSTPPLSSLALPVADDLVVESGKPVDKIIACGNV